MRRVEDRIRAPRRHGVIAWRSRRVVGTRIDACSASSAVEAIAGWAHRRESRAVTVANVHVVMEAHDDAGYAGVLERSDLVTPDGMPLVWALRSLGSSQATRVYGPDLMEATCARAARDGVPIGLYGGSPAVLRRLRATLERRHSGLRVAFAESPPFRPPSAEEDASTVGAISASGARILFVGLGCPKQERWIDAHLRQIPAVMIGVGAAFDFLAGAKPQAPRWLMRAGLEWLFRLASEPRRLWRRYARHNPRFVALFGWQLLRTRSFSRSPGLTKQR